MAKENKKTALPLVALLALVALAAILIYRVAFYIPAPNIQAEQISGAHDHQDTHTSGISPVGDKPAVTDFSPSTPAKPTLRQIVASARYWGPAYIPWYGSQAPDFTVTDLNGKQHRLSDYRGKNVMLIFFATWCRPCIIEIPHLVELRRTIGKDKLTMLTISYIGPMNSEQMIKDFVANHSEINYPIIAADLADMPAPYNNIRAIPASFFITPNGKIKLATEGLLTLPDIRAIIEAQQ